MKSVLFLGAAAIMTAATPASAGHLVDLATPWDSRGECEAAVADFNSDDRSVLLNAFPNFFDHKGDVGSFLTRAFTCELSEADGQWYITDHRSEVLASDWYQHRHD